MSLLQLSVEDLSSMTETHFVGFDDEDPSEMEAPKLFGREKESLQLMNAYQRVTKTKNTDVVFVHGESGSGKSSLIDTLREPVCQKGYFCAGKFFQDSSGAQEAYSAIMAAFSDLCDLINQSEDYEQRREHLLEALGEDIHMLSKVISSLSQFLLLNPDSKFLARDANADGLPGNSPIKFMNACKTFLRSMTSPEHPVVLVLDDIQWIDEGSLQLVVDLLEDSELKNVLLILVHRDNEGEDIANAMKTKVKSSTDIHVKSLDSNAVHMIVTSSFCITDSDETRELSELVYQRSHGNPYFVMQFVEMLYHEGLLSFSGDNETPTQQQWSFDVDKIRRETMLSDTLSNVLQKKIQRLPVDLQETLKAASVLGFNFKREILAEVMVTKNQPGSLTAGNKTGSTGSPKADVKTVNSSLHLAETAGFVERTNDGNYQFTHDKLQSTFHAMVTRTEAEQLHLIIGSTFLACGDEESMYHAAIHLNRGKGLGQGDMQRVKLARINLDAAKYCHAKSAFFKVALLLQKAYSLIPKRQMWSKHHYLTLEVAELLARIELVTGRFSKCKELCAQVLGHVSSVYEKIDTLVTSVEVHVAENNVGACIEAANEALKMLGVEMPHKLGQMQVAKKLIRINMLLRGKTDEYLLTNLPTMKDRAKITAVRLLVYEAVACLLRGDDNQAAFCTLLGMELCLTEGLSPFSANVFSLYSVVELARGKQSRASRFGDLALALSSRLNRKEPGMLAVTVVTTLITHWSESLRELSASIATAVTTSLANGDVLFAAYSAVNHACLRIFIGGNVVDVEVDMLSIYTRLAYDLKQEGVSQWLEPSLQFLQNLQYPAETWHGNSVLTGEVMEEGNYVRSATESKLNYPLTMLWMHKLQLAYHFGFYSSVESIIQNLNSTMSNGLRYHFHFVTMNFYGALSSFEQYRTSRQRKSLRQARAFKRELEKLEASNCPNSGPLLTLLIAEELSTKRTTKALLEATYNTSIKAMSDAGLVQMQALANERAGFIFSTFSDHFMAKTYFQRAMSLYRDAYGAVAKHDWLQETAERLLGAIDSSNGIRRASWVGNTISVEQQSEEES
jgi:histidine kinase